VTMTVMAVGVPRKANSVGKRMLEGGMEGLRFGGLGPGYMTVAPPVPTTLVCRAINRNSFIPGDLYWISLRVRGAGAGAGAGADAGVRGAGGGLV